MKSKSCRASGSDKNGLADTCTDRVDSNYILIGENSVFDKLDFHEFASDQGFLLSCGNDISSDNSL